MIGRAGLFRGNSGQVVVLVALLMVPLLAISGLVIDVGYAYFTQRSLQTQADAAALAGAQRAARTPRPTHRTGEAVRKRQDGEELPGPHRRRHRGDHDEVPRVGARLRSRERRRRRRDGAREHALHEGARDPTPSPSTSRSTACSPCGTRPLDIMLVLDRTGSMCQDHNGNTRVRLHRPDQRAGRDEDVPQAASTPMQTGSGSRCLPPATSTSNRCTTPQTANYNSTSAAYTIVPLSHDYSTNGVLNTGSQLVSTINCQQANGETSYATAIEKAQAELDAARARQRPQGDRLLLRRRRQQRADATCRRARRTGRRRATRASPRPGRSRAAERSSTRSATTSTPSTAARTSAARSRHRARSRCRRSPRTRRSSRSPRTRSPSTTSPHRGS